MEKFIESIATSTSREVFVDPVNIDITVAQKDRAREIVIVHTTDKQSDINFEILDGTKLSLIEVFTVPSKSTVNITLSSNSLCNATVVDLFGATSKYDIQLEGRGAESEFNSLQLTSADKKSIVDCRITHNASDCNSRSLAKSIASEESKVIFKGMVYVAQDAQRTNAEQNSRNIQLSSKASIVAEPQLEIYADDVKCSHGATVGQLNDDVIFYMRQRGISEELARKIQLEGFAKDIISHCNIEDLRDQLNELVEQTLHSI
ncbi:MAG: SufD family Fe-S cluster assembly protein [Rikenellaceae bacterium]